MPGRTTSASLKMPLGLSMSCRTAAAAAAALARPPVAPPPPPSPPAALALMKRRKSKLQTQSLKAAHVIRCFRR